MADDYLKHLLIGTAGHVDHGKTALIGALTGIDTDRLEEEHERGISIVLGFAEYEPKTELPALVGIVDVPGHERFIKTMVAGATGVDVALFVVAADEGVKPQTREHLEILNLLGVQNGIIVLTKIDLVDDPEWTELVAEDVRDLVAGTFLASAPVVPVSSVTGEGIEALRETLETFLAGIAERRAGEIFRLPIDRSFTIKGIGTVITGSVWSGSVKPGDPLEIQPSGLKTRVKEIQQHGRPAEMTAPGTRSALALHGVSVEEAAAGSWLVTPKSVGPVRTVDLAITHLGSAPAPLKHNQRVRIHHGTQESLGRLRILGAAEIPPGEQGYAQLHLEEPIVAVVGDRVLIRRYSPMRTIAGAEILDLDPARHKRSDDKVVEQLEMRAAGDPVDTVTVLMTGAGLKGLPVEEAATRSALTPGALLDTAETEGWLVRNGVLIDQEAVAEAVTRIVDSLEAAHDAHPLRRGLTTEALASELGVPPDCGGLTAALENARENKLVSRDPPFWRRRDFSISFEGPLAEAVEAVRTALDERGITPMEQEELEPLVTAALERAGSGKIAAGELLEALTGQRIVVRYPNGLYLGRAGHERIVDLIREHFAARDELTVPELRDLTGGLTRKYIIPILEYLDSAGVTVREGDVRVPGPGLGD